MKIKDMQDKEKQSALLARALKVSLTDESTETEVIAAEGKAAQTSSGAPSVAVAEQDVKALLAEIKLKVKDGNVDDGALKAMVTEVVRKNTEENRKQMIESIRKGEFNGIDADPGSDFSRTGKTSRFGFKSFITGNAPKRSMLKHEAELRDLQDLNDEILVVSKVLNIRPQETDLWKEYEPKAKEFAAKAMYNTATQGAEFIPTNFSAQVVNKVRLELKVAGLFDRIPMRSNPYVVPLEGSDATAYLAGESTGDDVVGDRFTASQPGTTNVTFTAKKLAARIVFSDEITQDSIVDIIDYIRNKIVLALANGIEQAVINGDTTATHMDASVTSSADARKAWAGLRKLTQSGAKKDAGGDALDCADLRAARKLMGKYGINPRDLAWIVSPAVYHQMLSESDSNGFNDFRTLDTLGPQAVILTGQLGAIDGIPVIVSEFVREDLNASGVDDTTTNTRSLAQLVNRSRFWFGDRMMVTMNSWQDVQTDQTVMVIKQRLDFQPVEASSNYLTAQVYNILS